MIEFGIIAGGEGSRLREEGAGLPKPLMDVGGEPMVARLIEIMRSAGAQNVTVLLNRDMPEVEGFLNFLQDDLKLHINVICDKTPSSFHSLLALVEAMNPQDKFVVCTVDSVFKAADFFDYCATFAKMSDQIDALMGVTDFIEDEKPLYVTTDQEMNITSFSDSYTDNIQYISAGIYGLRKRIIPFLKACDTEGVRRMRNFQRQLLSHHYILKAYDMGKVIDADHLSDIKRANDFINNIKRTPQG